MSGDTCAPKLLGTVPVGLAHIRQVSATAPTRYRASVSPSVQRSACKDLRRAASARRVAAERELIPEFRTRSPRATELPVCDPHRPLALWFRVASLLSGRPIGWPPAGGVDQQDIRPTARRGLTK